MFYQFLTTERLATVLRTAAVNVLEDHHNKPAGKSLTVAGPAYSAVIAADSLAGFDADKRGQLVPVKRVDLK